MKDKHLNITEDIIIYKELRSQINGIVNNKSLSFYFYNFSKVFCYFIIPVFIYFQLFSIQNHLLFIISYVVMGILFLLLAFNLAHDLSHNTIFRNNKLNDLFFTLIYAIEGAHAESWKHRHVNSHHFAPNVEKYDTDLQITDLIRVTPGSTFKKFHKYQWIYAPFLYTTYSMFWVFIKDFKVYFANFKEYKFSYHLSFWIQKIFYIFYSLISFLLFSEQPIYIIFSAFIIMHLIQSLFLLFTFFMTHHVESTFYPETNDNGIIQCSWFSNQIKSSNDMHPFSNIANFILGGFNNHIAHHLFPNVHHFYYPRINKVIYKSLIENNFIPNKTTYLGGILSHLRLLKNLSINPN